MRLTTVKHGDVLFQSRRNDVADHVLFVIPPGTGTWVANAATSHFRSQYNDSWGISLSAVMVRVNHSRGKTRNNVKQSL